MQCHTQAGSITTTLKVKIDFALLKLSATKIVTWYFHKGIYDMILGRYLLTALVLNVRLSGPVIGTYYGPFKGSTSPMVDLGT